ncbi:uncharacterized protein LOC105914003 [Setaria italica]|uniref:uncharacterized protein LOC105914003 n=1 Tax=Setaria italica TaxID=4555 RepID=UPI00064610BE|nr:uncharacterized protein LOC105914003 [Setaria italica]
MSDDDDDDDDEDDEEETEEEEEEEEEDAAPRDFVPPLAPKKALRVSTTSAGPTVAPLGASDGVVGEAAVPPAEVAFAAATGKRVLQSGTELRPTLVPPSAFIADPAEQGVALGVPPLGEVINLDDEAEELAGEVSASRALVTVAAVMAVETAAVAETVVPAPTMTTETAAAAKTVAPALAVTTETAAAAKTVAPALVTTETAAAAKTVAPALAMTKTAAAAKMRPRFMLDNVGERKRWQAVQGGLENVRAALSSAMGELDGVVVPGGQECSRGKSKFLRHEWGVWERFAAEMRRTGELTRQLTAAQQNVTDLQAREQEEHDLEAGRKVEAERVVANLGAEVSRLHLQMQELQVAVSQGLDQEHLLRAQSEGLEADLTQLRDATDSEHAELANLRDAVRIICEDLHVVQEEGTSTLVVRVLGMYRQALEITREALHVGVRWAFIVFGSHYSGINFDAMSGGYAFGYSEHCRMPVWLHL